MASDKPFIRQGATLPVYLDYQSNSGMSEEVSSAIYSYWRGAQGNPHSEHEHGLKAKNVLTSSVRAIADFVGCLPREITLLSGATAANNLAVMGVESFAQKGRNRLLISAIEHTCTIEAARFMERARGFKVDIIPVKPDGRISMADLEQLLGSDVALVSIMLANNEIGTIQDISTITQIVHQHGSLLHTDAVQAAAKIPIDVLELDCDLLSFSAHKLSGPIGIGALYVRDGIELQPLIHGGGQQRLISGTMSPELSLGFAEAVRVTKKCMDNSEVARQNKLILQFESELARIGYVFRKNGTQDISHRLPGTTHLTFQNVNLDELHSWIRPFVSFSGRSACSSTASQFSHVLRATGLTTSEAKQSARFSVSYQTTQADIITAVKYFEEFWRIQK